MRLCSTRDVPVFHPMDARRGAGHFCRKKSEANYVQRIDLVTLTFFGSSEILVDVFLPFVRVSDVEEPAVHFLKSFVNTRRLTFNCEKRTW